MYKYMIYKVKLDYLNEHFESLSETVVVSNVFDSNSYRGLLGLRAKSMGKPSTA